MLIAEARLGRRKSKARSGRDIVEPTNRICQMSSVPTAQRCQGEIKYSTAASLAAWLGRRCLGGADLGGGMAVLAAPAIVRQHEIGDARRDLGAEARAVEHAVMADGRLQVMRLVVGRNVRAQPMRRLGLADAGNVVVLALDRHQARRADLRRIDRTAAMRHLALRQRVADEHGIDGLQIEFGGQIHHREILVVEFAVLLRGVAVAFDQMEEQVLMRLDVAVEIHAHEAVQLQEARIDVAHDAGMRERHLGDDVVAEPVDAALTRPAC